MNVFKRLKHNGPAVFVLGLAVASLALGCGGGEGENSGSAASGAAANPWVASPAKVVEGLMVAYETRDDSLYASLLADEFRYYFEPPGAAPEDVLGWGKEEDLVATGNLFKTPDVDRLSLGLQAGEPQPVPDRGGEWMMVPVAGGELRVEVRDKEPMVVTLNRQEIYVRKTGSRWQVAEWRDYPAPDAP